MLAREVDSEAAPSLAPSEETEEDETEAEEAEARGGPTDGRPRACKADAEAEGARWFCAGRPLAWALLLLPRAGGAAEGGPLLLDRPRGPDDRSLPRLGARLLVADAEEKGRPEATEDAEDDAASCAAAPGGPCLSCLPDGLAPPPAPLSLLLYGCGCCVGTGGFFGGLLPAAKLTLLAPTLAPRLRCV